LRSSSVAPGVPHAYPVPPPLSGGGGGGGGRWATSGGSSSATPRSGAGTRPTSSDAAGPRPDRRVRPGIPARGGVGGGNSRPVRAMGAGRALEGGSAESRPGPLDRPGSRPGALDRPGPCPACEVTACVRRRACVAPAAGAPRPAAPIPPRALCAAAAARRSGPCVLACALSGEASASGPGPGLLGAPWRTSPLVRPPGQPRAPSSQRLAGAVKLPLPSPREGRSRRLARAALVACAAGASGRRGGPVLRGSGRLRLAGRGRRRPTLAVGALRLGVSPGLRARGVHSRRSVRV
jgi:hypothetical protein